jgi:uncharacterized DUF497 family protein
MADTRFDWDPDKDAENQRKHGVSFIRAQYAFADPHRVIARDTPHSQAEDRYFCFGEVDEGILTVRLPIAPRSFESSARVTGGKERPSMNAKIKYTDEPLGTPQIIPDFLPSPSEMAFREEGVKVTLALSKKSLEFIKSEAARHQTHYQRMIRKLLDAYVDAQAAAGPRARTYKRRSH